MYSPSSCISSNVYLFSSLNPLHSLDSLISQFIWNKSAPRIKKEILQKPKQLGGLALPNFLPYYWAANFKTLLHCCHTNSQSPPWLQVEEASCSPSSLMSLLCLPLTSSPTAHSSSVVVKNCLNIWNQFRRHFGLQAIPVLAPVHSNPLFTPSVIDKAF